MTKRLGIQINSISRTVLAVDEDCNIVGEVDCAPEVLDWLLAMPLGNEPKPKYSVETIAALIEEMTSKGYDQMKARTLTAIEAATGQSGIGDKPLGRQIGYALDDAKRVALEVLEKRAPEITQEMLAKATEDRQQSERIAKEEARVTASEFEVKNLRDQLERAERRLAETKAERMRLELQFSMQEIADKDVPALAEAVRRTIARSRVQA